MARPMLRTFFDRLRVAWKRARRPARQADMRQLTDRLFRLWRVYCIEIHRWRIARTTYGCNSPAATMQESVARSVLEAYFDELEKHIDQEPEMYRPIPREDA